MVDCLLLGKVFGFLGLAEVQANMEKFLVQIIQQGLALNKIRELFPYLADPVDIDLMGQVKLEPPLVPEAVAWLDRLPRSTPPTTGLYPAAIRSRDSHAVRRSASGGQPPAQRLAGGCSAHARQHPCRGQSAWCARLDYRRSRYLAWSATYAYMDMLDYRIERCRDGRYYRKDGGCRLPCGKKPFV